RPVVDQGRHIRRRLADPRPARVRAAGSAGPRPGTEPGAGRGRLRRSAAAAGLARLIEDHATQVCAAVGDGSALLAAVAEHRPDVVVADVRMPPTHTDEGLRAAIELRRAHPTLGVLVLSQYIETRYTARLLEDNAAVIGYMLNDGVADVAAFAEALERVAAGGTALDPEVVSQLVR